MTLVVYIHHLWLSHKPSSSDSAKNPVGEKIALSGWCLCGARLSASKNNTVNLILRLFLYHFLHTMSSWHHEPSTTTQTTNKHHHHGDGTPCPSSGVDDSMNPRRASGRWPCSCLFQGCCQRVLVESINYCRNQYIFINLMFNWIRAHPPATMVAKTASIIVGSSQ